MTLATRMAAAMLSTLLVVGVGTLATGPAKAVSATLVEAGTGTTAMPDQVLRRGCRSYAYTYSVSTSTGDWVLETFLVDPDGNSVSSGVFISDSEPAAGSAAFGVCRSATRFGDVHDHRSAHDVRRLGRRRLVDHAHLGAAAPLAALGVGNGSSATLSAWSTSPECRDRRWTG